MNYNIDVKFVNISGIELILGSYMDKLCLCDFKNRLDRSKIDIMVQSSIGSTYKQSSSIILEEAIRQLNNYFNICGYIFDIPLLITGTLFQKSVYASLLDIPYGSTVSYGDIAKTIGNSSASRAVGMSCKLNRLVLFIPCHRVVSSKNRFSYSGGEELKSYLINYEREYRGSI